MQKPINTRYKIAATEQYLAFLFPLKAQRLIISVVHKSLKKYITTEKRMRVNEKTTGFERRVASLYKH